MIVMPCMPYTIDTERAKMIATSVARKEDNAIEYDAAAGWESKKYMSPDFVTLDGDGDIHLNYIVVSHVDPTDDLAHDIAKGIIGNKMRKKVSKEFAKRFADDLDENTLICVQVMFLISKDEGMEHGIVRATRSVVRKMKRDADK